METMWVDIIISIFSNKKLILNTLYKSPNINFVVISRAGLEPKAE